MPVRADVLSLVAAVSPYGWDGVAFRHTAPQFDPLSGEGSRIFGGRWNPRGLFGAVYLAQPREACLAEFRRMAGAQGQAQTDYIPRVFYSIQVTGLIVLDLRLKEQLTAVGLTETDLHSPDWSACQSVAEAAHFLGYEGIIAPSATGTGVVISVFDDRTASRLAIVHSELIELATN